MKGLLTLLRWDFAMQYRYGFWIAGLVVTIVWTLMLWPLPESYLEIWLPCVLYFDIGVIGLMFVAGLLFFERRQGVIDALVVTPMRTTAWLLSKLLSLTLLATVVACALVLLLMGPGAGWIRLVPSFALAAALFTLIGFLMAARFASVSGFLVFFGAIGIPFALPILDYFGIWSHPLLWLNPAQPTLVLIRQAFRPGSGLELGSAVLAACLWIAVGFQLSVRAFHRQVSYRRGAA